MGLIGDNILGWLPQKWHLDIVGEANHELILNFWDTSTIISPNRKDLKWQRIGVKTWEKHPTHYLQGSQVMYMNCLSSHNLQIVSLE